MDYKVSIEIPKRHGLLINGTREVKRDAVAVVRNSGNASLRQQPFTQRYCFSLYSLWQYFHP